MTSTSSRTLPTLSVNGTFSTSTVCCVPLNGGNPPLEGHGDVHYLVDESHLGYLNKFLLNLWPWRAHDLLHRATLRLLLWNVFRDIDDSLIACGTGASTLSSTMRS